jgi:imidazoleglycerol phosphate dehydratase HisB
MTTRITLFVDQGTDFGITLNLDETEGTTLNTANSEFFSSVRKVFSSSKSFDIDVQGNGDGAIDISIAAETTANVAPGKYEYDILMKTDDDKTFKLLEGLLFVIPTMTKIETQ